VHEDGLDEDVRRSRLEVSRRRALSLGGTIGLGALLAACAGDNQPLGPVAVSAGPSTAPPGSGTSAAAAGSDLVAALDAARTCQTFPEQTQGPFWFDVDSIRSDIREDRPGTVLELALRVLDVSSCAAGGQAVPVSNAVVDVWHCDAGGRYSGFETGSATVPGGTSDGSYSAGDPEAAPADDGTYLRGAQVADTNGIVQFTTIFPGWYPGRTTHIHAKVHVARESVLSTQLYFPDETPLEVNASRPYRDNVGRPTRNADDGFFAEDAVMTVSRQADRYRALLNLGILA
jgi:protocatechuate 3,4-dioxygenase beta subunit